MIEGTELQITHYGPMDAVVTGNIAFVGYEPRKEEKKP
jgi:hypothetical protein